MILNKETVGDIIWVDGSIEDIKKIPFITGFNSRKRPNGEWDDAIYWTQVAGPNKGETYPVYNGWFFCKDKDGSLHCYPKSVYHSMMNAPDGQSIIPLSDDVYKLRQLEMFKKIEEHMNATMTDEEKLRVVEAYPDVVHLV